MSDQLIQSKLIRWVEPNRGKTPPLHIASRGDRYSTVTGVAWLRDMGFVAVHRNGMKLAYFDLRAGDEPVAMIDLPCQTDDIAVKQLTDVDFEIAVSGCWNCAYVQMRLSLHEGAPPEFIETQVVKFDERTFCHGVEYAPDGRLWLAFSTGENPRIQVDELFWHLPEPWGARDICFNHATGEVYALAVSSNPKLQAYGEVETSVWQLSKDKNDWRLIWKMGHVHADACRIRKDTIWFTDQLNDRIIGVDLTGRKQAQAIESKNLDFPHGLCISSKGMMAVTNYGDSSVALFDISNI